MLNWSIQELKLELKYTWKISRNSSDHKTNFIIHVKGKGFSGVGEVAPNIRYQETPAIIKEEFIRFLTASPEKVKSTADLTALLDSLQLCNALRFGIESAYIHYECASRSTDVCTYLGVSKPGPIATSFSLPIMDVSELALFYSSNNLQRFKRLKVKINTESGYELLHELNRISKQPLILDANEAWPDPDQFLQFLEHIKGYPVELIEQPIPATKVLEYQYLKQHIPYPLFADESICAHADFEELKTQFHGINMKLMKAGGYINGLRLLEEARKNEMQCMIGCMVETSLGISSAMNLCAGIDFADLDGSMIIRNEPYGLMHESDGRLLLTNTSAPAQ